MDMIFGTLIWVAISSILLALISLITEKTVFFLKKPSTAKALFVWFGTAIISVVLLAFMKNWQ